METFIHTADGKLEPTNLYRVGRRVRKVRKTGVVAVGDTGIIAEAPEYEYSSVSVHWQQAGKKSSPKNSIQFIE